MELPEAVAAAELVDAPVGVAAPLDGVDVPGEPHAARTTPHKAERQAVTPKLRVDALSDICPPRYGLPLVGASSRL